MLLGSTFPSPYRAGRNKIERLARVLHNIRGRFLLSYNDCEAVRKLYEDCEITPLVRRNNLPSVSTGEFHEVLISNYTKSQGNA